MPESLWCWRCKMVIPMLTESEWEKLELHLTSAIEEVQQYRQEHNCSLAEAKERGFGRNALRVYRELTGFEETNFNSLFHHRLSIYGPPCASCGKPLRTPRASFCAACGTKRTIATQ